MVGEMRDTETAQLACNAALTGHLVFSTLHTNDAPATLPRLLDLGIEPYLIASTLSLVIAQRLVRTICTVCRREYEPDQAEREHLRNRLTNEESLPATLFGGSGCAACGGSGYRGRTGIYEVLLIDDFIREALPKMREDTALRQLAHSRGMRSMRSDGFAKASTGETTLKEVLRIAYA